VPIEYQPRSLDEGKKIRAWHGVQALWVLLKFRLMPDEMMFGRRAVASRGRVPKPGTARPAGAAKPGPRDGAADETAPVVVELNINALSRAAARQARRNRVDESHLTAAD